MSGNSPSNQVDATSQGEPVKASTIEVPDTPGELAKRDSQIAVLMVAMEESRAREERMTQMLLGMQQKNNCIRVKSREVIPKSAKGSTRSPRSKREA